MGGEGREFCEAENGGKQVMISVIVPMFNAEKTLRRCVDSVIDQGGNVEILLIDDGSADGTLSLACLLAEEHPIIKVIEHAHGGVSAARNAGINAAKGEWLLFLDADDALLPGALNALLAVAKEEGEGAVNAVCGLIVRGNEPISQNNHSASRQSGHALLNHVLANPTNYLTVHGWLFRNMPEMPLFNASLRIGEDSEWALRYLENAGSAAFVPVPVYKYTVSDTSAVHAWRQDKERDFLRMLETIQAEPAGKEKNFPLFVLTNFLLMLTHVTFHPANPHPRSQQFSEAMKLLEHPIIREAFQKADLTRVGTAKRMALECLKKGWIWPAWAAVKLRQRLNKVRA